MYNNIKNMKHENKQKGANPPSESQYEERGT